MSNYLYDMRATTEDTYTSLVRDRRSLIVVYRQRARSAVALRPESHRRGSTGWLYRYRSIQRATMLSLFESIADIPKFYYGLLLGIGFCIYYLYEVVKVSEEKNI